MSAILLSMLPEIHPMEKFDFPKSVIHSQIIKFFVSVTSYCCLFFLIMSWGRGEEVGIGEGMIRWCDGTV